MGKIFQRWRQDLNIESVLGTIGLCMTFMYTGDVRCPVLYLAFFCLRTCLISIQQAVKNHYTAVFQ